MTAKSSATPRPVPVRTCVACRTSGGKRGLLRVVRLAAPKGATEPGDTPLLALDPSGKKSGRGAYVCPTAACVEMALKRKSLDRSLKTPLTETVARELREYVAALGAEAVVMPD